MDFILASGNPNKANELNELLKESGVHISAAPKKLEVIEDGVTFQENALKKAKAYYDEFGSPAVADDSGLVVESMPDILGVYSARFAPECSDYEGKNKKLLEMMADKKGEERSAYFVCYLCFYISAEEIYFFEGRVHGEIGHERKGDGGFGYDPVFEPTGQGGQSLAQLHDWKMENSHRAKACKEALIFFKNQK